MNASVVGRTNDVCNDDDKYFWPASSAGDACINSFSQAAFALAVDCKYSQSVNKHLSTILLYRNGEKYGESNEVSNLL